MTPQEHAYTVVFCISAAGCMVLVGLIVLSTVAGRRALAPAAPESDPAR